MVYDAIIIGAGMSGLAAAIRLAHFDQKVCVLEKHYVCGGLNSYYKKYGFDFDVGLHAMTNYCPPNTKKLLPLTKILRQLRLNYDDFDLIPQIKSSIQFKDFSLTFTNDFEYFKNEIENFFPHEKDNFQKLIDVIMSYDELNLNSKPILAREIISQIIKDPILIDMLLCPLSYYGSAHENDMEFGQFVIMFKSIFMEGFARPQIGVRQIIKLLENKLKEYDVTLKLKSEVISININDDIVSSLTLSNGEEIVGKKILSTIGLPETLKLIKNFKCDVLPGNLSFTEAIYVLDENKLLKDYTTTILFYNQSNKFNYCCPKEPVDYSSGVICCPNNFQFKDNYLKNTIIRVTNLANHKYWFSVNNKDEYNAQKDVIKLNTIKIIKQYISNFDESSIKIHDIFTPKTIYRYTGRINGAVYGTPNKVKNGITPFKNLFIAGTDQGFLGITGAILSGISIANLHFLKG